MGKHEPVFLTGTGDMHQGVTLRLADRFKQVDLPDSIDLHGHRRRIPRSGHETLRREMEYPIGSDHFDETPGGGRIRQVAVEQGNRSRFQKRRQRLRGIGALFDEVVHLALATQIAEMLHAATPATSAEYFHIGVILHDILCQMTSGEARDPRNEYFQRHLLPSLPPLPYLPHPPPLVDQMLKEFFPAICPQPLHHLLGLLRPLSRANQNRIARIHHNHIAQANRRDEPPI
jgi:hypothetical protein